MLCMLHIHLKNKTTTTKTEKKPQVNEQTKQGKKFIPQEISTFQGFLIQRCLNFAVFQNLDLLYQILPKFKMKKPQNERVLEIIITFDSTILPINHKTAKICIRSYFSRKLFDKILF